ncbi:growth hormone secretagogue receptor type 1-like [Acropora millepora]|uniref:growth hormone secretagogue receptor type 1-like n=1 Tax=Acropora millepora TaxID=45264 RepID=UPI001CF25045|nr:growth hormone secretagogue receptor type 1-like [Acropora millepora]
MDCFSNSINSSENLGQKTERHLSIFFSIRVIFTVICISANFLLIRAFCKFANLRTASNLILVSLCIADCFIAMIFILDIIRMALKKGDNDKLKCILCQINASLTLSITTIIVLHLALISVERVIAVKFSLRYNSILTNRRALLASVALWVSTALVTAVIPQALSLEKNGTSTGNIKRALHPCSRAIAFKSPGQEKYVIFFTTLMIITLLITLFCHGYIFAVSYKHRKQIRSQNNLSRAVTIKEELKRARVIFLVVASNLLSFVPLFIFLILRFFGKLADDNNDQCYQRRRHTMLAKKIIYTCAMGLNAICPPIIYGFKNQQFKTALLRMVKCT